MNVVDSSGWLEYFADASNATFFAAAIEAVDQLIVPSISLLEVFKRLLQQRAENEALQGVAYMRQGRVIDLDADLAVESARLGTELKLPLADSVILATARRFDALLWTQDSGFENINGVRYRAKPLGAA